MNYTGPRNGVTQSWRACAGPKASNVPIVVSKAIAWSSAARACYSNATPAASRPRCQFASNRDPFFASNRDPC